MNYPESIYNKYEIIEKDIYGEKHYCLVRIYSIFGISFRRKMKVTDALAGRISISTGKRWHSNKNTLEEAVKFDDSYQEYKFRKKVTK